MFNGGQNFSIMALRFGYQFGTTGFRHANPISYRSRSLSPIPRRNLSIEEQETNSAVFTSARSMSPYRFSSRQTNYSDYSVWRTQTEIANRPKSASGRYTCTTVSNRELQPCRLTPIASSYIYNNTLNSSSSFRDVNIEKLQNIANSQYKNAIKALNQSYEMEDRAYVLKDAIPAKRSASDPHLLLYKKQYSTKEDKVLNTPKLQPKHIKPLGVPNNEDWCSTLKKIEELKALSHKRRNIQMQSRPRRSNFSKDSSEITSKYAQQRKYSTIIKDESSTEVNLQYPQEFDNNPNTNYLPATNNEKVNSLGVRSNKEVQLQTCGLAIANADNKTDKPQSYLQVTPFYNFSNNSIPIKQIGNASMSGVQPQLQPNLFAERKGNVILYYKERNGKKTLCSKILRENENVHLPINTTEHQELSSVRTRAGPKLMLQSMEDCVEYSPKELTPAHNERFMVPWLSWGDRVKLRQKNKYYKHNEEMVNNTKLESESTSSLQTSSTNPATLQPQQF